MKSDNFTQSNRKKNNNKLMTSILFLKGRHIFIMGRIAHEGHNRQESFFYHGQKHTTSNLTRGSFKRGHFPPDLVHPWHMPLIFLILPLSARLISVRPKKIFCSCYQIVTFSNITIAPIKVFALLCLFLLLSLLLSLFQQT